MWKRHNALKLDEINEKVNVLQVERSKKPNTTNSACPQVKKAWHNMQKNLLFLAEAMHATCAWHHLCVIVSYNSELLTVLNQKDNINPIVKVVKA